MQCCCTNSVSTKSCLYIYFKQLKRYKGKAFDCKNLKMQPTCKIVALWKNVVDRPESYDSFSAKGCIFLAHEKTRTIWGIILHAPTAPRQGIKIFLTHLTTTLVPSLTLQILDIVQSSLESATLQFFAYHWSYSRSRCLVTWQREINLVRMWWYERSK
jgi:hypothetical protein